MQYKALGPDGPFQHVETVEEASVESAFATIILDLLGDLDFATVKTWGLSNYSVQDEDGQVYTMLTSEPSIEIPDELLDHVESRVEQIVDMHFDLLEDFDLPIEILEAFWDKVWETAQAIRRDFEEMRAADREYDMSRPPASRDDDPMDEDISSEFEHEEDYD